MNEQIISVIINGLQGKNTHLTPKKALEGLTPTKAKQKPEGEFHSCWEILHHIVIWQETMLRAIKGEKVDWEGIERNSNWPASSYLEDNSNFTTLVQKFEKGLFEAEKIVKKVDLFEKMPTWDNELIIQAFIVLLQHNSYHLGQIIAVRKIQGSW